MGMRQIAIIRMSHLQLHVQTEEQHDETHSNGPWTQAALDILPTVAAGRSQPFISLHPQSSALSFNGYFEIPLS